MQVKVAEAEVAVLEAKTLRDTAQAAATGHADPAKELFAVGNSWLPKEC